MEVYIMKNMKTMFFILTVITLFLSVSAVCAVNDINSTLIDNNDVMDVTTVADTSSDSVVTDTAQTLSNGNKVDIKTIGKEEKNLKKDSYTINQNNYQNYFSTTGLTGVNNGDTLTIDGDYTLENIVINGSLKVNGTNNRLNNVTINGILSITGSNNFINDTHSIGLGNGEIKGSYNEIYNSEIASLTPLTGSYNIIHNVTYKAGTINGNYNYINSTTITTTGWVMLKGINNTINNSVIPKLRIMSNAVNTTLDNVTLNSYINSGVNTTVLNQPTAGLNNINQNKNLKTSPVKREGRIVEVIVDETNLEDVYIWGIFDFTSYCMEKYGDDSFEDVDELRIILKTSLPQGLSISNDFDNDITIKIIGEGSVTINGLTTFDYRNAWSITQYDIDLYIENVKIRQTNVLLESTGAYPIIMADENCRVHMKNVSISDVRNYNSITYNGMIISMFLHENGNSFENCTMQFSYPTTNIDWSGDTDHPNLPLTIPIQVNSESNSFLNNNITFKETTTQDKFPTCWGFYVNKANNLFDGNNIKMTGTGWLYTIDVRSTNNTIITNNIINTTSTAYGASIYLEGYNLINNTVANNTIYTYAGMEYGSGDVPEQVIYPVCITDMAYQGGTYHSGMGNVWNNTIANNTITGSANNIYGFEQFGGDNTVIANNTFNISGATPTGIGVIGINSTIYNNIIHTSGLTNQTLTSADYLKPRTTGMYLYLSYNNTIFNNSIDSLNGRAISFEYSNGSVVENNTVNTTNYTYTITFDNKSFNNIIQYNTLISTELQGDASVNNTINNIVKDNLPKTEEKSSIIVITTTTFTQGENNTISASFYSGDERLMNINKGKVAFKVNGKTLKDTAGKIIYVKVVNGTATIENYEIPSTWKEGTTIQAIYSGSTECKKLTSEKTNITIVSEEPTITTEDVTATTGSKVTLKATVTGPADMLNNAKVVFKINGKSVKDENGKVIYAKIVNGEVSVEYTIPENFKTKDYTLTAVYISSNYDRMEDSKTLTVN
ncbi:MAG: hypothetical protein E7Z86_00915 [Methanosphaera stadtmanae]|jgi:parallel beta-helix repeat protein|nr:hypothetical protein [Methanosphaera stadtmanae]